MTTRTRNDANAYMYIHMYVLPPIQLLFLFLFVTFILKYKNDLYMYIRLANSLLWNEKEKHAFYWMRTSLASLTCSLSRLKSPCLSFVWISIVCSCTQQQQQQQQHNSRVLTRKEINLNKKDLSCARTTSYRRLWTPSATWMMANTTRARTV